HPRTPAFARWQKHLRARFAEDHPAAHTPPARRRRPARPSRLTLLTRAGEYALGGVRAREMHFTPGADGEGAPPCELIAMNNIGYAAVRSAKLISVPQMLAAAVAPGLSTTNAFSSSPLIGCGTPIAASSITACCVKRASSTSRGYTLKP